MNLVSLLRSRLRGGTTANESLWGFVVELIGIGGAIVSFTLLGRSLGPDGYGAYASLYAIVAPLVALAASGVTLALLQHLIRDDEPLDLTARSCLTLALGIGLVLTVVGTMLANLIIEDLATVAVVAILLTEFVAMPVVHLGAGVVQARRGFAPSSRIRLLVTIARIVVLIALFALGSLTITALGVTMLFVTAIIAVFVVQAVGQAFGFGFRPGRVRWHHLRTNMAYSVGISTDALGNDGDKLVLAANGLVTETGLYAAAYRIVQLGLVPVSSVISATHNRFLDHEHGKRRQHLDRALRYGLAGAAYGLVFAVGVVLVAPLLPLVLGKDFEGSVEIVRWLAPIVLLRAVGAVAVNALMGLSKVTLRTVLIAINAGVAMLMYIVLIPRYGWEGAAVATVAAEALSVVMMWTALVVCQRRADREADRAGSDVGETDADDAEEPAHGTERLGESESPLW